MLTTIHATCIVGLSELSRIGMAEQLFGLYLELSLTHTLMVSRTTASLLQSTQLTFVGAVRGDAMAAILYVENIK